MVPDQAVVETVTLLVWAVYSEPLEELLGMAVSSVTVEYFLDPSRLDSRDCLKCHHMSHSR
jgi:hypothetical protein